MSADLSPVFDLLFRENQPKVYRLALGLTGNTSDAEEITQESFLRAFRSYNKFRGDSSFFTWIYRIAVNVASDYQKKRTKLPITVLTEDLGYTMEQIIDPDPSGDPETIFFSREIMYRCLHCFTECLPAKQRTVFCLAVTLDLPYKTTAEILECSLASVKTTVHRAKKRIAGYLEGRCQFIKESNPCRCSQWVRFALGQGWIAKDLPVAPPVEKVHRYREDVMVLKKTQQIYQSLYPETCDEALGHRIKQGIEKKEWAIFG